ncbi:hypothetical protein ACGF8B_38170 [Streptomyces sp. NPDC047917]|uniref:hypothetical protein n=1 Tax=Streptomyces sp. NPDC047917 TaxID=3365491 RepID=UPI003720684C
MTDLMERLVPEELWVLFRRVVPPTEVSPKNTRAPFPAGPAGAERAGIDLVLLDTGIAGCVSSRRSNNGSLDGERHRILHRRIRDLDRILPLLSATEAPSYWHRLHQPPHTSRPKHIHDPPNETTFCCRGRLMR